MTLAQPSSLSTSIPRIFGLTRPELTQWLELQEAKSSHADRIFRSVYKQHAASWEDMTFLPHSLREQLQGAYQLDGLAVEKILDSSDGTRKILFRLDDGSRVETVCIPSGSRLTLCVSSQVGCALGCKFCYTASMGPGRNLSVAEYIGQCIGGFRLAPGHFSIVNVVFMGMGEPLVNLDSLLKTLQILTDPLGPKWGVRRITVSTAGLCPQILALGQAFPARLALSLHATTNPVRDELMPINRRYNIETLFSTLQQFQQLPGQEGVPVLLEYTLIQDTNDSPDDAHRLAELASSIHSKINLIPYNEHPGAPYKRPSDTRISAFFQILQQAKIRVTCRQTRGDDILAACGQLAITSIPNFK